MGVRLVPSLAVLAAGAALLSACTFSPGISAAPKVNPADLESVSADAYEAQYGVRPDIDCGEEFVPLELDYEVACVLVAQGLEYDAIVTITSVNGTTYSTDIAVADVPNNAPDPTVEPDSSGADPVVPGADLAGFVTEALTPELGYVPSLECDDLAVAVGNTTTCIFEDSEGEHEVLVTVTSFDGTNFEYNANIQN